MSATSRFLGDFSKGGILSRAGVRTTASGAVSREDLEQAAERIRRIRSSARPHACRRGAHQLPPAAHLEAGTYPCERCGTDVDVPYPLAGAILGR